MAMFKRLMNVLTICAVVFAVIFVDVETHSRMAVWEIILFAVVVTSITLSIILAVNYIVFKKLTIWHRDS